MVRIMGNSTERVPINDLGDVIYFKQIKEYTDIEFETSKDLKRELNKGKLILLEKSSALRGSEDTKPHNAQFSSNSLSINDLRLLVRETLLEIKNNGNVSSKIDIKEVVKDIAPLIVDVIRQEVSKISVGSVSQEKVKSEFQDLSYVPDVSTEGMISNIEAKKKEVSGDAAQDALAALRRLNQIK